MTHICLLESGCAGNQDPPHKSLVRVWHGAQKKAWELGQTMASWAVAVGRARARLGRELATWYITRCCIASSVESVAFAPEKAGLAASISLREFPGSHCDSSQVFLEPGTIGSRFVVGW